MSEPIQIKTDFADIEGLPVIQPLLLELEKKVKKAKTRGIANNYISIAIDKLNFTLTKAVEIYEGARDSGSLTLWHENEFYKYRNTIEDRIIEFRFLSRELEQDDINETSISLSNPILEANIPKIIDVSVDLKKEAHTDKESEVMNLDEAAKFLGFSKSWLHKNHKRLGIPSYGRGKLIFNPKKLQEWVEKQISK